MKPRAGWGLAVAALALGALAFGWRGLVFVATAVVFWLLMQFSRSVRVMRDAAGAAIGQVPSAVMLHAKLRTGLPMLEIVKLTKSLGQRLADASADGPDTWRWADASGAEVQVVFDARGRCARWRLMRPAEA